MAALIPVRTMMDPALDVVSTDSPTDLMASEMVKGVTPKYGRVNRSTPVIAYPFSSQFTATPVLSSD